MKKILNINKIVYLILLSLIAKIFAYQIYADNTLDNEWLSLFKIMKFLG